VALALVWMGNFPPPKKDASSSHASHAHDQHEMSIHAPADRASAMLLIHRMLHQMLSDDD
jgi:hypothetical protein